MRISTVAQHASLTYHMLAQQKSLHSLALQQTSGYKAPDYATLGGRPTAALISAENKISRSEYFITSNKMLMNSTEVADVTVEGILTSLAHAEKSIRSLSLTGNVDKGDLEKVQNIQKTAFDTLQSLEYYSNQNYNGEYMFAGGKFSEVPFILGAKTHGEFIEIYDGQKGGVTYPGTVNGLLGDTNASVANLSNKTYNPGDLSTANVTTPEGLPASSITPTNIDNFKDIAAGTTIKIKEPTNIYSGTYTVQSNTAGILVVTPPIPAGVISNATFETISYYKGGQESKSHSLDDNYSMEFGIHAGDIAFEKAVRALGLLAQGIPREADGTMDAVEMYRRLQDATVLIHEASRKTEITGEPGKNQSFRAIAHSISLSHLKVKSTLEFQTTQQVSIYKIIEESAMVDTTEVAVNLKHQSTMLQMSMAALTKTTALSLMNFI